MNEPVPRVMTAAAEGAAALAECSTAPLWPLSRANLKTLIQTMHVAIQSAQATMLHALREAEGQGIPAAEHAASANLWLRSLLRISPSAAAQMLATARLLDTEPALDDALVHGTVNTEQLAAIRKALADLPDDLDATVRADATDALIGMAQTLEPAGLRAVGRRVLEHVAPEAFEADEERRLRENERTAHERRFLSLTPVGDGSVRIKGLLDAEAAAIVTAALDPLCAPAQVRSEAAVAGEARTPAQRRADALVDVFRIALAGQSLPDNGGDRPQVTVTAPFDVLARKLGAGLLDSGEPVSAEAVRRMACDARILPIIFDGAGQVLDAGRSRRLVTGPLRRALIARDQGCVFPGCDRPSRWCAAHHIVPWSEGGATDLANLALLCGFHHRVIHDDSGWNVRTGADGLPEFLPPAWVDPARSPRRNPYHQRR